MNLQAVMTSCDDDDFDTGYAASRSLGLVGDFCSRDGAETLKRTIEGYWRERGRNVMISLHNVGFHPAIRAARYDVRSDMVNGMPRAEKQGPNLVRNERPAQPHANDDFALED